MPHQPSLDVVDDLRKLASKPYWLPNAEMTKLLNRAIEEIEVLRLVLKEVELESRT